MRAPPMPMQPHLRDAMVERAVHGHGPLRLVGYALHAVTGRRAITDRLPHPKDAVTLRLRGFSQLDTLSCGVVAGYSVVRTLYPHASFNEFYRRCRVDAKIGVTMANLQRALEQSGVAPGYRRTISFQRVVRWINEGWPIICNVHHAPDEDNVSSKHWLVIYGYRAQPQEVFVAGNGWGAVADGRFSLDGQHRIAWSTFLKMFNTSRHLHGHAFVCSAVDGRAVALAH